MNDFPFVRARLSRKRARGRGAGRRCLDLLHGELAGDRTPDALQGRHWKWAGSLFARPLTQAMWYHTAQDAHWTMGMDMQSSHAAVWSWACPQLQRTDHPPSDGRIAVGDCIWGRVPASCRQ